jgi:UDP-N-acetylglucosamine 1-carboxyvinyltransferase
VEVSKFMGEYHIIGGNKINGTTKIIGAKNAILPILAASILNNGVSLIHNCPKIADTFISIEILESLGCVVTYTGSDITVDSRNINNFEIPENLVRSMRSSIIFLGGLLGRFKKVTLSYPGGCEFLWDKTSHQKSIRSTKRKER